MSAVFDTCFTTGSNCVFDSVCGWVDGVDIDDAFNLDFHADVDMCLRGNKHNPRYGRIN